MSEQPERCPFCQSRKVQHHAGTMFFCAYCYEYFVHDPDPDAPTCYGNRKHNISEHGRCTVCHAWFAVPQAELTAKDIEDLDDALGKCEEEWMDDWADLRRKLRGIRARLRGERR